jgi:hypothetical protein
MGHISTLNILAKANKSLGFLRSKFPEKIKKRTYQTIVRPNGKSYSGGKPLQGAQLWKGKRKRSHFFNWPYPM